MTVFKTNNIFLVTNGKKKNNNNMVQRRIYTVNVVKKPVKIQFFERFHWGTKARRMREQKHGTFPFLKRKNKLNMFLWNRFITCFNGPHSRHPAPYRESSIWLLLVIPAAITSFTGCLWVVFAHENRTKGGLFQEEPGHNCFLEDNWDSRCYETFCVLSDQCSAYCTCHKHRNQQ